MIELKPLEETLPTKSFFKSYTVWFNIFIAMLPDLVVMAQSLLHENVIQDPLYVSVLVKLIAFSNIVIRVYRTKQPIKI